LEDLLDAEEEEEEYLAQKQREEEELQQVKHELINRYIRAKGVLKYEKKRNAFFQDRIYRTSVRKGILIESELDKDEEKKKKKHHKSGRHGKRHRSKKRKTKSKEDEEKEGEKDKEKDGKEKKEEETKKKSKPNTPLKEKLALFSKEKKTKGFGEAFANEVKYQKLIRRIIKILNSEQEYFVQHELNLRTHEVHMYAFTLKVTVPPKIILNF
jgi:hypothetical protein